MLVFVRLWVYSGMLETLAGKSFSGFVRGSAGTADSPSTHPLDGIGSTGA